MPRRPFRLTCTEPSEHDIQSAAASFLDVALPPGTVHFAVDHGAGKMTPATVVRLRERGGKKGVPDHFVFHAGHAHLIEFKTRTGRVSHEQRTMHERLAAAGIAVTVCCSVEDVVAALQAAGVPLRAKLLPSGAVVMTLPPAHPNLPLGLPASRPRRRDTVTG